MDMKPVVSSNVASVGYDPATKELAVEFRSGKVYTYEDIDSATYQALQNAPSVGKFIRENIIK